MVGFVVRSYFGDDVGEDVEDICFGWLLECDVYVVWYDLDMEVVFVWY